jgi:methylenetetrahydrofolate--tRNA-(uracil-5-)-methyltransferase
MGLLVARFLDAKLSGRIAPDAANIADVAPPRETALGSLLAAITDETKADHFQPTNINFGHLPAAPDYDFVGHDSGTGPMATRKPPRRLDKHAKRAMQVATARTALIAWIKRQGVSELSESRVDEASRALAAAATQVDSAEASSLP